MTEGKASDADSVSVSGMGSRKIARRSGDHIAHRVPISLVQVSVCDRIGNQCLRHVINLKIIVLVEATSSLSPQAAEFVPRSMLQTTLPLQSIHQYSKSSRIQDRLRIAREAPLNTVYVPPSLVKEDIALEDALQQQCNIQDSEIESYNKYKDDRRNLNKNKSIAESNFRYNGARFCKYFDNILEDCKEQFMFSKELFRDLLYFQCRLETRFEENEWQKQSEEKRDQKKCNGLILFLAELVAQMDESFAFTLGEVLVWFITKVLQRPASNSVKYICQALKLAGHVLEKDKSKSKDMENMMRALTELVNNGQVDTHVGNMVNSVHELRKDWGRKMSNCDLSGTSNALSNKAGYQQPDQLGASNYNSSENTALLREAQLDQPVMYGPDGEILSAEESKFLQDNIKLDFDNQRISEDEYEDDNYDDEIASAYEEFLKDKSK
ncbi:Polyadenylate-binding protein-interacting protein 1 [Camponotus floridanus]|uniref:Polyadenylate-binding protein-interacting protein 1 n=1 Tax=Camponotus floridanus TaxID=104421 RepID=E2AIV0_CAMFO|nr:Polyadenylate-binding protein-interacting protein 1 [Camponotus floridanus]